LPEKIRVNNINNHSFSGLKGLSENLKKLTKGFKENFVSSTPLEEEIDETIEKFA